MKKKDLDVLELMRESLIKANSQLGFTKKKLNEQAQESAFKTEFDVERDMPSFKITKDWGTRGTTDAKELDAVIKSIIDISEKNGLKRYKKALQKLNEIVGATESVAGELPVPAEEAQLNLGQIVSSLQLKNLIHSIIAKQDAAASGKIYETLMARIAGGFMPGSEKYAIQDFEDGDGNYISLKTIASQDTDIKGSKFNLALGIAKKGKVIYLVNVKDAEDNPFKMTPFSFVIDKDNYFYFITKGLDRQKINDEIDSLVGRFSKEKQDITKKGAEKRAALEKRKERLFGKPEESEKEETPSKLDESTLSEQKDGKFEVAEKLNVKPEKAVEIYKKLFPAETTANIQSVRNKFKASIKSLEDVLKQDPKTKKLLANAYKLVNREDIEDFDIAGQIFTDSGTKIYKRKGLQNLIKAINYTDELSGLELALNAETDEKVSSDYEDLIYQPKKLSSEKVNDIKAEFEAKNKDYVAARQKLHKGLMPFYTLYDSFVNAFEKPESVPHEKPSEKSGERTLAQSLTNQEYHTVAKDATGAEISGKQLSDKINNFWNLFTTFEATEETLSESVEKETQFSITIAQAKAVAKDSKTGQLDESYPTIVVTYQALEESATKSAELFKQWARPVFEGMHYLKQGINQYFIEDSVDGLSTAQDGIEKVDSQITKISETGLKATELKENKQSFKEYIKKSPLDDILEDLIK
jgi:hypothetical protein